MRIRVRNQKTRAEKVFRSLGDAERFLKGIRAVAADYELFAHMWGREYLRVRGDEFLEARAKSEDPVLQELKKLRRKLEELL